MRRSYARSVPTHACSAIIGRAIGGGVTPRSVDHDAAVLQRRYDARYAGAASTMWSTSVSETGRASALRIAIHRDASAASYAEVVAAWRHDPDFCAWFDEVLARAPFSAFRWETPPVTSRTSGRPFEFVLVDSPELQCEPDAEPFEEYFAAHTSDVLTFANLGGDAMLVVPRPLAHASAYGHIAAFVRHAPRAQRLELWAAVGDAMSHRLGPKPVWLSTAGGGVAWLHVRLDDRPKYYAFAPYRAAADSAKRGD